MVTVPFSGDLMKLLNVNQQYLQSGKYTTIHFSEVS